MSCPCRRSPSPYSDRPRSSLSGRPGTVRQEDASTGIRTYRFPVNIGKKTSGPSLRKVGKTGRLQSVFLPAKIGDPEACNALTSDQHRLLQALVRETTRAPADQRQDFGEALVIDGNTIPNFWGTEDRSCLLLDESGKFITFGGNGKRKGLGYRLTTPGGWLNKAGYPLDDVASFLDDLSNLSKSLGLTVVGLERKTRFYRMDELRRLSASSIGRRLLDTLHLRIYTTADYLQRWAQHFGSMASDTEPEPTALMSATEAVIALLADMDAKNIIKRRLAAGVAADQSFLVKVLAGQKPWPDGLLKKVQAWIAAQRKPTDQEKPVETRSVASARQTARDVLPTALGCLQRGWCVLPQRPGAKHPCVKWKPFQERLPTEGEVRYWFRQFPDAGLVIVLGPVSKLFVIDVDGPEAHAELLRRLGSEPVAPKVLSGSGKPFKYHLYFTHPDLPTRAKQTHWHPQLEFRGHAGLIVLPPSLHPCGKRYRWAPGQSPDDLVLPPVPAAVLEALKPARKLRVIGTDTKPVELPSGIEASPRTLAFLSGKYAEGPNWNDRLFAAACDLHGRNVPKEVAEPLLLAGAKPWDYDEDENALRTIASAYSQPRTPARD